MDFFEIAIQTVGTAAMATLAVVCWKMAHPKNNPLYLAVGQTVFKWIFVVLAVLVTGRVLAIGGLLSTEVARYINSVTFLVAIVFIVISVLTYNKQGFVDSFGKLMKKNKSHKL